MCVCIVFYVSDTVIIFTSTFFCFVFFTVLSGTLKKTKKTCAVIHTLFSVSVYGHCVDKEFVLFCCHLVQRGLRDGVILDVEFVFIFCHQLEDSSER